jgi:hypothetical protein
MWKVFAPSQRSTGILEEELCVDFTLEHPERCYRMCIVEGQNLVARPRHSGVRNIAGRLLLDIACVASVPSI